jgi:hypothetical protein
MLLLLSIASANAGTEVGKPKMMDGVAIYSVDAGGISARFCFDEADNHYASAFVLLVNTTSSAVEVGPSQITMYSRSVGADEWSRADRWGPSEYSEHLTHPRSWIGLGNLLVNSDSAMLALVTRSRAEFLQPAAVTTEHVEATGTTLDRMKSATLQVLRPTQPTLSTSSTTNGLVPTQSEDMLLRSTTLLPGASVFGAVPFKVKVNDKTRFRVDISLPGRAYFANVMPRE